MLLPIRCWMSPLRMTVTWPTLLEEEEVEEELQPVEVLVEQEVEEGHPWVEEVDHSLGALEGQVDLP